MPCLTQGIFSNTSTTISSRWNWTITKQRVSLFVAPEFPETENSGFQFQLDLFYSMSDVKDEFFFPKIHLFVTAEIRTKTLDGADPENLDVFFGFFLCFFLIILRLMQACPSMTTQTLSPWLTPKAIHWQSGGWQVSQPTQPGSHEWKKWLFFFGALPLFFFEVAWHYIFHAWHFWWISARYLPGFSPVLWCHKILKSIMRWLSWPQSVEHQLLCIFNFLNMFVCMFPFDMPFQFYPI